MGPMIVNTRRLFVRLLPALGVSAVCDVGSMDGTDALRFRKAIPRATIYAFEPNPENLWRMVADGKLRAHRIEVVSLAAGHYDGDADFFLVQADYSMPDARRGMSSLYRRSGEWAPERVVRVGTTRLDTFLSDKCAPDAQLALWVDAEGAAYEVITGIVQRIAAVRLVHVEVETAPCIGAVQKLYPDVKALLVDLGFTELATDRETSETQFNALFARSDLPSGMRIRIRAWLLHARLRYLTLVIARTLCPACVQRLRAWAK